MYLSRLGILGSQGAPKQTIKLQINLIKYNIKFSYQNTHIKNVLLSQQNENKSDV